MEEKQNDGARSRDPGTRIREIVREEIEIIFEEISRRQQESLDSLLKKE